MDTAIVTQVFQAIATLQPHEGTVTVRGWTLTWSHVDGSRDTYRVAHHSERGITSTHTLGGAGYDTATVSTDTLTASNILAHMRQIAVDILG